jgi:GTPase
MTMNLDSASTSADTRAGYAALIGFPNAGKSSLMNQLLGEALSIVTPVAQTTRARVVGIDTRDDVQIVYVDTPGLVEPQYLLHHAMLRSAVDAISDSDAVVLVVDCAAKPRELAPEVVSRLAAKRGAVVVALNKIDLATDVTIERAETWVRASISPDARCHRVSATTGTGVAELRELVGGMMPKSPFLFPPDEISSQPVRFFVAEMIRETVLEQYQQEIPHSVFVEVDEFREASDPIFIRATVYVERNTQKQILIGRGGSAIRTLGTLSRAKIEQFVGSKVFLDLWVKVLPKWRKQASTLRRFGFSIPTSE